MQRILRTCHECAGIDPATHEKRVRKDLMARLREYWNQQQPLLHHCGHFRTLRRVIVTVEGSLDEDRIGGFERQHAMLCQISGILEYAAQDTGQIRPEIRSCSDIGRPPGSAEDGEEAACGGHWMENERSRTRARIAPASTTTTTCESTHRGETCPSRRTAGTGRQGRRSQRRRGKLRPGRDVDDAGPGQLRDRARRLPPIQSGWPISSFSSESDFTKFVSEEIATARARYTSRRRQNPMPASPHHRARCNLHEARARVLALLSCCLVRLSNEVWALLMRLLSSPACTQRSICHGAAPASRLDPLAFHWRQAQPQQSSASRCARRDIYCGSRTSQFSMRPRTKYLGDIRKRHHLRSHQLLHSRCNCTSARLVSRMCGVRLLQS